MVEKEDSLKDLKKSSGVRLKRISYFEDDLHNQLKQKFENLNAIDPYQHQNTWLKSKRKILKNLIILGLAWTFQFTAYQSMANLQSSLNVSLGTATLSSIYVALILSCLLVPSLIINKIGLKWTIVCSQICYLLFIAANIYPKWYILVPAGIILGVGAAPLWAAKCTYLTEIAGFYAEITGENKESVLNRFFGIFFAMFQTAQIWGNVISSSILKTDSNSTLNKTNIAASCGAFDCPGDSSGSKILRPLDSTVYTLCGIYIGFTLIGISLIAFLLNSFNRSESHPTDGSSPSTPFSLVISTVKQLKNIKQLLIIPISLWLGFSQATIGADFAKSFVSCTKGVNFIGLTLICYGVADVIGSYLFGYLAKFVGRLPCIILPAVLNYAMIILMLVWIPNENEIYVLFIIPVFWGLADAGWQTQLNSLYGVLFPNTREAAFSNFKLWEALGFAIAYAYSSQLCVSIKLYLLLVYLSVGLVGYFGVEFIVRRNPIDSGNNHEKLENNLEADKSESSIQSLE